MNNSIETCSRCLYPESHPLGLVFDEDGVCSGCRVHEEKDHLDWVPRFERLTTIANQYRSRSGTRFDCVVPVSGARDSYFIVDVVKNRLGLNPLLVSYNRHYNTAVGHRNLAHLRTVFDCDYLQFTLSPATVVALARYTLQRAGSFHWHAIAGQTVWPVQVAVRYRIPLIVWGAHQGVDQVGMFSHLDEVEMSRWYRKNHDLMGFEPEDIVSEKDDLPERELTGLFYPSDMELSQVGVRGIYLNNFIRWDTKAQHEEMIREFGYETAPQQRTFDRYNDIDCAHYSGAHDKIKYIKHGFGKARDHACREIRFGRLSRTEAAATVARFEEAPTTDDDNLLNWLGLDSGTFWSLIERHRSKKVWRTEGGRPVRLFSDEKPDEAVRKNALKQTGPCEFQETKERGTDQVPYRLFARGFVS